MTLSNNTEPTISDVINLINSRIDQLSIDMKRDMEARIDRLSVDLKQDIEKLEHRIEQVEQNFTGLKNDVEKFNNRFSDYQQAVQWVVQLAFTLIASATLTVIISSVLRK